MSYTLGNRESLRIKNISIKFKFILKLLIYILIVRITYVQTCITFY